MVPPNDFAPEPPISDIELRQLRELLKASTSTRAVITFVRLTAIWITAVAAATAAIKYLIIDFVGKH